MCRSGLRSDSSLAVNCSPEGPVWSRAAADSDELRQHVDIFLNQSSSYPPHFPSCRPYGPTSTSINPENDKYKFCWNVREIFVLLRHPTHSGKWFQQVLRAVPVIKLPYLCVTVSDISSFKSDVTIAFLCLGCRLHLGTWPNACHLHKAAWLLKVTLL